MGDSKLLGVGLNIGGILFCMGLIRAPFGLASVFYLLSVVLFYYYFKSGKSDPSQIMESGL